MKKRLLAVLTAVIMVSSFAGTTVFAEETFNEDDCSANQEETLDDSITTILDLNQLVRYRILEDGTMVPVESPYLAITQHTIEAGETMAYGAADGSLFRLLKGITVNFQARFNKIISYECGFSDGENPVEMKNTTGLSFNAYKTVPETCDDCYFYITNNSDGPVTVKSGKIEF